MNAVIGHRVTHSQNSDCILMPMKQSAKGKLRIEQDYVEDLYKITRPTRVLHYIPALF